MSVYTQVGQEELAGLLDRYGLAPDRAEAALHGIENSTYLIDARNADGEPRRVVLTVFEQFEADALMPYLDLLANLSAATLPVAAPLRDRRGHWLQFVQGKPTVLVPRLPGHHCFQPQISHCHQVGALLARLHRQPPGVAKTLLGERQRLEALSPHLYRLSDDDTGHANLLLERWSRIPAGKTLIHGDLFRDNVLFDEQGQLTGVLDFYNACTERPEYDLAVALNDWGVATDGRPVPKREAALLAGYRDGGGRWDDGVLRLAMAVAALRFWLSRLAGPVSDESEGQGSKDPSEFARIFGYRFNALGTL